MADVYGTIGNEQVELNNAATEQTLKALLALAKVDSNTLQKLAIKSGVDASAIAQLNSAVDDSSDSIGAENRIRERNTRSLEDQTAKYNKYNVILGALGTVTSDLMEGTASASKMFTIASTTLSQYNPVLSQMLSIGSKLLAIQEQNFAAFQKMSNVGVNFAGDLIELRQAAAGSYLTLDQFSNLASANGEMFARMGGSANQGAIAFSKFSNNILKGEFGTRITALGYSFEDANQYMATFIGLMGVKDANDLRSSSSLVESTKGYLDQLDRLADITGKSRKEQEEIMKKQALTADVNMTAAKMTDEKQRAAFLSNVQFMTSMYGDAGKDMAVAQAQGRSVITKGGQMLSALAPGMQSAVSKMQQAGEMYGVGSKQYIEAQNDVRLAAQAMGTLPPALYSANKDLQELGTATNTVAKDLLTGQTTKSAMDKAEAARQQAIADAQESSAAAMANMNKAFLEVSAAFWKALKPVFDGMTPVINGLADFAGWLASLITEFPKVTAAVAALGVVVSGYITWKLKQLAVEKAGSVATRVLGGGGGAAGGGAAGGVLDRIGGAGGAAGGGMMQGVAAGLRAFANPQVAIGAAVFAASIAAIGAGIAAAAWLTGKALPTLAEGLTAIQELDGENLLSVAKGAGAFGLSLLAFVPSALFIMPAALGVNMLAEGLLKMNKVDTGQLLKVAEAMEKVNAATPSVAQTLKMGFAGIVNKVVGPSTPAAAPVSETSISPEANPVAAELKRLNSVNAEMLRSIKEVVEYSKRNVDATKSLNGNLFATV
jgi:hypothetical protein